MKPRLVFKRELFGGALFGAGLTAVMAPCAATANFIPVWSGIPHPGSYTHLQVWDPGGNLVVNQLDFGVFPYEVPLEITTANADGVISAYTDWQLIGATATVYDPTAWHDLRATKIQYFKVNFNSGATVNWEMTSANIISYVSVYQLGVGELMSAGPGTSGSMFLELQLGEIYIFSTKIGLSFPTAFDTAFANIVWQIPAPGAIALLGLGMLGMKRRRRE